MRAGGKLSYAEDEVKRVPHAKPPFTLAKLKKAIPPHCFKRSAIRSLSYLGVDIITTCLVSWAMFSLIPSLSSPILAALAWPIYWMAQGVSWSSLWVIAHECGHHAFSDYQWLDDTVGLILHSFLFVPYFSWKISHRRHHSNAGCLERDEVHVPKQRHTLRWHTCHLSTNPLGLAATVTGISLFGWPFYLIFNFYGRPYSRFTCHFDPNSPIFTRRERAQVWASNAALLAVLCLLAWASSVWGLGYVCLTYIGPLAVVNGFLVLSTMLHHTHVAIPHYDSSQWDWLRGSLATVDRSHGAFFDHVSHHIMDTHVVHHLFSAIPHYHAVEATRAIRSVLGDYYRFDPTPCHKAVFRECKACVFVEPDEGSANKGVFWFRNLAT